MLINIAKIDKNCRVLGPGKRYIRYRDVFLTVKDAIM